MRIHRVVNAGGTDNFKVLGSTAKESQLMLRGWAKRQRKEHVTSAGADRPDSEPAPGKSAVRDTESIESLEPPHNFESMAKMMLEIRKQLM